MSNKDWQVGPVLKDKLNSQGTLFRGGTKYSAPGRFPKGYTPERQAEVADAVVRTGTQVSLHTGTTQQFGTQSSEFKDRSFAVKPSALAPDGHYHNDRQPVRNLVDNIARSTVPVAHLQGVQFRTDASPERLGPNAIAHWDPRGDALSQGGPVIRLGTGTESTSTTIHEIGHHVSHVLEGNTFPRDEEGRSGGEEAFADNYATQHFRDRKGQQVERGPYGGGQMYLKRTEDFWHGYRQRRDWGITRANTAAADEEYFDKYPEERVHKDGSQDVPLINKGWNQDPHTPVEINEDALPAWHEKYTW